MVPERALEGQSKLSFAGPSSWNALQREVHMGLDNTQVNDGETTEPWGWASPAQDLHPEGSYTRSTDASKHTRVACCEGCPNSTWRLSAVVFRSASTVWKERGDRGCIAWFKRDSC